jgi:hypothetical protein
MSALYQKPPKISVRKGFGFEALSYMEYLNPGLLSLLGSLLE